MKSLFLIGAGGHCHSVIDVVESSHEFHIAGIFDPDKKVGESILGYKVIGGDDKIKDYVSPDHYFLICVGQIKSADIRSTLFEKVEALGGKMATVISSRAYVSKHSRVGRGTVVMHDAVVNAKATIGHNCIINTKALLEHDVVVGNHCHVSTASVLNGNVTVQDRCFIGSNAVVREGVVILEKTLVPAGTFFK